jgi:hypothetical protein
MADDFTLDKYFVGTVNLGEIKPLIGTYANAIVTNVSGQYRLENGSTGFAEDLIPGDVVRFGSSPSFRYYQLVVFVEATGSSDAYWKIVAAPGTIGQLEIANTMDAANAYNFLNWNTTYWYNGEIAGDLVESDIVCSRSFRSLNNRLLSAMEQIGRLSDKVTLKLQALESYCDFIKSLYNASQVSCDVKMPENNLMC